MSADPYASDHAAIEHDLGQAVHLDFPDYLGFLAHYGARLRELAAKHPDPEVAFRHLRAHADQALERLAAR